MPVLGPRPPVTAFPGTCFTPIASPSRGSARTSVWEVRIDAGAPARPHDVTTEEILVVLSGRAQVSLGGVPGTASAGDAIVVPPDTELTLCAAGDEPVRLLAVLPVGGQARTPDGAVFTPPWAV